jgi:hypothetical protein
VQEPKPAVSCATDLALEFQRLLDERVVNSRAEIARRHGLSRARVTQVLNLLGLPQTGPPARGERLPNLGISHASGPLRKHVVPGHLEGVP